jgi:RNA polymerase sigma-70 factor (family 1)
LETDNDILYRLKNGDPDAFEVIFWQYNAKVHNFVMSILYDKSMAQDITQSVFLSVWEHHAQIDISKNFSSYIFTIAQNQVYRCTEKALLSYNYQEHVKKSQVRLDVEIEDNIDYQFLERLIWELIDKLPSSRKEIFMLSRKQGLSNKEIAQRLSISEKTVETQITRSIHYLRKHINPHVALVGLLLFHLFMP